MPSTPTANGSIPLDREGIAARRTRLEEAREALKNHFVGIDRIIDELCDAVMVWYVAPELLTRPVIVNLWGMTGVGKTDLVRRLVRALDITDRFVEIELSNADSTTWHSSVVSRLSESGALEGRPTFMLFDEIQRFNTLDHEGNPVPNTKFSDFWELLSDGRLARRENPDLQYFIASLSYSAADLARRRKAGEEIPDPTIGIWQAKELKSVLRLTDDLEQLAALTPEQALVRARGAQAMKVVYEPIDCSRSLILVSGNLDEAFTMATAGAEADVDADLFAAYAEKVTVVDIKTALTRRFKPEQVARFGNTHLIYSSLRQRDFVELIQREVDRVRMTVRDRFGVEVLVDPSVNALIYRNGVFPVQGVRPVFSSVADILENNLAKLLFRAVLDGRADIAISYDEAARQLVGQVGPERVTLPFTGRLDKIREGNPPDKVANVAVHEAGHAVLYAVHFRLAPLQLTARVAATYVSGFTSPHPIYDTADALIRQVKVALAGGIAEEIVFGRELASVGRAQDRERATILIVDFIRRHGFDSEFQANYMLPNEYSMDRGVTDPDIEKMVARLAAETRAELGTHRAALLALAEALRVAGRLDGASVADLLAQHGISCAVRADSQLIVPPYASLLHAAQG
ncbi:MAG: peptidase M41 [Tetrasphaera sp.]|nr:peptidase M41 [Tetrasphaera sp.]